MSTVQDDSGAGAWDESLDFRAVAESSLTLPGMGDPGPHCGEWAPYEFCDDCADVKFGQNTCGRRSCPNCSGEWARDRTVGIVYRLAAARYVADGWEKRAVHAVISPPEGEISTLKEWYDAYRDAYQYAVEQGVRGGVAIGHGFRVLAQATREFREADPDMGKWQWLMNERPEMWRAPTYFSPHFHIIGLSDDFEENDPEAQDGWVAERLSTMDRFEGLHDKDGLDDMAGAARYVMSHATFEADSSKDCVRWFGSLATTNFSPEQELSEGAQSVLMRHVEEVVNGGSPDGEEGEEECCDECGATSRSPIWDAGYALQDKGWCQRISERYGRERERELQAAFEWAIGERMPPPGLKGPRTEEECKEAFRAILD